MTSTPIPLLHTRRLLLTPLETDDAAGMVDVLADRALYEFTGGTPPDRAELEARYAVQVSGSGMDDEVWYNWVIRLRDSGAPVGFVQATVREGTADVAWLVGTPWQRRGIATEAGTEMCHWLATCGVDRFTAHIHAGHVASQRVATALGLSASEVIDDDGEVVWISGEPNEAG